MRSFLIAVVICLLPEAALTAAPSIDAAISSPYRPAKMVTVKLRGQSLHGATDLWTSFAARAFRETGPDGSSDGEPAYTLFVPVDLPAGIGALRVATTNGPSDLQLVMLDDLPAVAKVSSMHSMADAQELNGPVTLDGYGKELGSDYFKVTVATGARLSVEILAHRLGSPFDPVVRLLAEDGRELIYCDDAPGAGADARFSHQFSRAGTYFIEVRDTRYQGGPKFFYRLRAGDFPLDPIKFLPPAEPHPLRMMEEQFAEVRETEANDTIASAMKVTLPVRVKGGFSKLRDQDFYSFEVAKDERWVFESRSRSLGFSCDVFMQLRKADGSLVVEANVTGPNEAALTNRFNDAGTYVLMVEELTQRGGPDLRYELEMRRFTRGFDLSVETDAIAAPAGGTIELKVNCARREYDGPVTLQVRGLGDNFLVLHGTIAEKTNSANLKLSVPADAPVGRLSHFTVVGEAQIDDRKFETPASTMPALRKQFPQMLYPPAELDGWIALGITPAKKEERPQESPAGN